MDIFRKRLLASLVAIALIASAFTGFVMTGTAEGQPPPTCPLDEDFSGAWPPSGWATDDWLQSNTNHAGGTAPEAWLRWNSISDDYAYLDSKTVDTTCMSSLTLEFKSFIEEFAAAGHYDCRVKIRCDGSDWWTDVTPWSNPIYGDVGPDSYSVNISSDIGSATLVRFEFDGRNNEMTAWYVDDVKICGVPLPPPPSNFRYLHSQGGLFNLTDPVGTQWHELWPIFCNEYHLSSWNDTGGDGVLSHCDWIDMYEKPDGELKSYHVENVTITLNVTHNETGEPMYIELEGGYNSSVLTNPVGSQWHEIYPNFCPQYQLSGWEDNDSGELDFCDYIVLTPEAGSLSICPLIEDFSGPWSIFPPSGWAKADWTERDTNHAGGTVPEAYLPASFIQDNYSLLQSKPVDTTGASNLTLEFKSFILDRFRGMYVYYCFVFTRADASDPWTSVEPWDAPIKDNVGPATYSADISSDIGNATQVQFRFTGDPLGIQAWYVDDVKICYPVRWHVEDVAVDIIVTPKPPPVAAFNATPTSGCAPLRVNFTDQSTGCPTSWNWTFGDGSTSSAQHPSYKYTSAGTYNVSLAVSNVYGSNSTTRTNFITVSEAPPVGGEAYPVSKVSLLAPWIVVTVLLAGGAGWYALRRRRARS